MSDGFIDLRQNEAQLGNESFWPSFTDIMTVVVMIFLLATSVLIVRNWELVNELQTRIKVEQKISQRLKASMAAQKKTSEELLVSQDRRYEIAQKLQLSVAAERRTAEAVQKTSIEKASLEEQLTQAQSDLSLMRLQLMQAKESATERDRLIVEQDKHISQITQQNNTLQQRLSTKEQQLKSKQKQLIARDTSLQLLQDQLAVNSQFLANKEEELEEQLAVLSRKDQQLSELSKKNQAHLENIQNYQQQLTLIKQKNSDLSIAFDAQKEVLAEKTQELESLSEENQSYLDNINDYQQQIALAEQKQSSLSAQYDTLEEKYNKLIKPSRSAIGKHVVEVRYEKTSGKELIQFRQSEKDTYQNISQSELHNKLGKLKAKYQKTLYVKIIIPDNSGLSYNEAWTFMMSILEKYDYYYQD